MHAVCSGSILFGLVTIPVKLYPETRRPGPSIRELHATCGSEVEYVPHCPECRRPLVADEIEKAHEVAHGEYVVLSSEELTEVGLPEASGAIDIVETVAPGEVDVSLVDASFWVTPIDTSDRAFALLRQTLATSHRVAVARVRICKRPRVALLRPREQLMSLAMLRFVGEMVSSEGLPVPSAGSFSEEEQRGALDLVSGLAAHFEPSKHPDEYRHRVEEAVNRKLDEGRTTRARAADAVPVRAPKKAAQVFDLGALLAESGRILSGATAGTATAASAAAPTKVMSIRQARRTRRGGRS